MQLKQSAETLAKTVKTQKGFTLIELMVVVVIMSVVVSVGVLSLARFNQDLAENQQAKIESFFKQVADQSAFSQKLYLIAPDDKGLSVYRFLNAEWLADESMDSLIWHEGFRVSWELDEHFVQQQNLPRSGWLFWPSGEVVAGKIVLGNLTSEPNESASDSEITIDWNEALEFAEQ
ncbi:prepilin-type N-terminal cleavage/methylation domain-containing protein [Thiomicrorhabdus lithotrophica]|uniref:Prepilin-type N-terminal cleavage/methylation domain-containing protein n=1 Tax=Thiomicrorhabdus lithotrophica TaxID=2949997 RepID=A0ABY8CCW7_9GAMM|nr:prepilin-type N-terminal cleavage/methylation domain-containing protein [Thiomicrorhabdus lithotrophica]WEJ62520.1 prepilin-type N-terminal cleavage/methylation domain-containing protein [Thiomicrorhabdus lithotrophica]